MRYYDYDRPPPWGGRWSNEGEHRSTPFWIPEGAVYDPAIPDQFNLFCYSCLTWPHDYKHGLPVEWEDWQEDEILRPALGLRWSHTGLRVVSTAFVFGARGFGKTTLGAALSLFGLGPMGVNAPEVDVLARDREQAMRVFDYVELFLRNSEYLSEHMNFLTSKRIVESPETDGKLTVRSGDAKAEQGLNPSLAIVDELMTHPNSQLWTAVQKSTGKRREVLIISLTTPWDDPEVFAKKEYDKAKRISKNRGILPSYLPVIFEPDPGDDIYDERTWHKGNPALKSGFSNIEKYREEAVTAKEDPVEERSFKIFRCAMWQDAGAGMFLMDKWDAAGGDLPDHVYLRSLPAYIGVDMSGTSDITSLCIVWWDAEEECAYVAWHHWCTESTRKLLDKWTERSFTRWADEESTKLEFVESNFISSETVANTVAGYCALFNVVGIGIDSFRSHELNALLGEEGARLPVMMLRTTGYSMSPALDRTRALVRNGALYHTGDPVARWMAANAEMKNDSDGNPKLVKTDLVSHRKKVDAIAALLMAIDRRLFHERKEVKGKQPTPAKTLATSSDYRKRQRERVKQAIVR